jgi:uncharacterized protein YjgD (DUF1641 family)
MDRTWTISEDEEYQLDQVWCNCRNLGITDPTIRELKASYIKLKTGIKKKEGQLPPKSPALSACQYYQHINLATLNRLWQSSVSVSSLISIIKDSGPWKAQRLSRELFSFPILAYACFSLLFEEMQCLKDPQRCMYLETTQLPPKEEVHDLLCMIGQPTAKYDELHIIRNKIVHLFPPGSGLYHSKINDRWLVPKPETDLKRSMQYYQEMIESDDRDTWFDQNPDKSDSIERWCQEILAWLVTSSSKVWKDLAVDGKIVLYFKSRNFMTPSDKVDKAIKILELIDGTVRQALKLQAYFCCAAYKDDIKVRFDQSKAALGYNQILDSLYFELIMTLVRLYDALPDAKHSENTASLPELMKLLSQKEVAAELQARSEQRKTPKGQLEKELQMRDISFLKKVNRDATLSAQAETSEISFLVKEFEKLKGSHLLPKLRSIRNELFAHTAIEQNRNNPAQYGNAEALLDKTLQFVSRLNSAVRNLHYTYQEHIQTWRDHADFFWQSAIGKEIEKPIG